MATTVTLRQLRYFLVLAEELHFGRAAERLHITQPPLSRQLAELEQALGVRLLSRDPRGVRLTAAGRAAKPAFAEAVTAVDAAVMRVAALGDALPVLRLGLLNWLDLAGLAALERGLVRRDLAAGVEGELMASHEAVAAVLAGRLEAALVAAPVEAPGLEVQTLASLRMVALVPAHSPLARRRRLALSDLHAVPPFYRFRRSVSPSLWDHFERQYRAHGFAPAEVAPATEAMGVLARIGAGKGCTLMPGPLAVRRYAGVARRPLKEAVSMDVALVTSPALDPALRRALVAGATGLVPGAVSAPRSARA